MKNKIKIFCLILAFFIVVALSSELVFSVTGINDNDCKRVCLENSKDSGLHEFCYNNLVSIRCDCSSYKFRDAVECDITCQGYNKESKYCHPNSCEYMCTWKRTSCYEYDTAFGTRTAFWRWPYYLDECEKRSSEDMKCIDKDGLPYDKTIKSKWQDKLFLLRFSGLKDAYWKKCSVPKSMGDCGTGDTSTACDENGCTVSTVASAKLIVPENALPKQQDTIEDRHTTVNLGIIISVDKDYSFYDYNKFENSRIIVIYNFYPNNLVFYKPSTLIIDYMHEMADGMIENKNGLDIYYYADGLWLPLNASHNKENKTLTAYINNLGVYALIELIDTTPPNITLNVNPLILWPPNNKLVDVAISGSIIDDISGVNKDSIKLVVDGVNKELALAADGSFNAIVPLIASRLGTEKEGHKYNINLTVSDNVGNNAITSAVVLVPHDQRK